MMIAVYFISKFHKFNKFSGYIQGDNLEIDMMLHNWIHGIAPMLRKWCDVGLNLWELDALAFNTRQMQAKAALFLGAACNPVTRAVRSLLANVIVNSARLATQAAACDSPRFVSRRGRSVTSAGEADVLREEVDQSTHTLQLLKL